MDKRLDFRFEIPRPPAGPVVELSNEQAEKILLEKLADSKDDPRKALWELAQFYKLAKQHEKALQSLRELIQRLPDPEDKANCVFTMGQAMEQVGDYAAAVRYYKEAEALEPAHTFTWYFINNNLGFCLNTLGKFNDGEIYCRRALAIDLKRPNAHKNLGIALTGLGQYRDAARCFVEPKRRGAEGRYSIIDLDLSKYDRIAARFQREATDALSFLKSGIETRNQRFNQLIEQIEHVAIHAKEPILLMGPTGAGKSQLARRIFELKKSRHQVTGDFVDVNCATLRGDSAMSTLFGHTKGAFTGAVKDRPGLLRAANGGLLFLDEVGELGLDEQAMLLRALEEKRFLPLGSDREVSSEFQLIAGTNRDLGSAVHEGRFREDLLARMNLWTFRLPGLAERPEDIEPNLDYELDQFARRSSLRATLSKEVREKFLSFARSPAARWSANFRDLNACVTRMGTLSPGGRITEEILDAELDRLRSSWSPGANSTDQESILASVLGLKASEKLDLFDRVQLASVIGICRECATLSEAGRKLFGATREKRKVQNDADRLRKYLARFDLDWQTCKG